MFGLVDRAGGGIDGEALLVAVAVGVQLRPDVGAAGERIVFGEPTVRFEAQDLSEAADPLLRLPSLY